MRNGLFYFALVLASRVINLKTAICLYCPTDVLAHARILVFCLECTATSPSKVLEVVLLSMSPERSQLLGSTTGVGSASLRGEGGRGVEDVRMNALVSFLMMQTDRGRRECGVGGGRYGWMDDDRRDA